MPDSLDAVFSGPILQPARPAEGLQIGTAGPASEAQPGSEAAAIRDGLEQELLQCASALTGDEAVALTVARLALARLDLAGRDLCAEPPGAVARYRMVREAYHSIERTRVRRAPRPSVGLG